MKLKGSCLCNQVSFELEGEPSGFFLCHCSRCRKGSGSAHAANLFLSNGNLTWLLGEAQITRFDLPGSRHARSFCATCGSPVPLALPEYNLIQIPAGAIDGALELIPDAHIFTASRADWDRQLADLPGFPGMPNGDED